VATVLQALVPTYFVDVLTRVLVFAIFAMGVNLLVGYSGLPSLGQAAFLATGAYTVGILVKRMGVPYLPASLLAVLAAGLLGALFGLLALRARGATFLLLTMALTQATWAIIFIWRPVTGGSDGFGGLARPELPFLPWSMADARTYYFFVLVLFIAIVWLFSRLVSSPLGLALQGIRDNELRMRSLGYNTWLFQYLAFIIAAAMGGVAGVLYAFLAGAMVPDWATVTPGAEALLMAIMGGPGTVIGPLLGAAIIVPGAQVAALFTTRWQLVLGLVYVLVILFARDGIVGLVRRSGQDAMKQRERRGSTRGIVGLVRRGQVQAQEQAR
jgi:branched-chain amino acid transport system permease protein